MTAVWCIPDLDNATRVLPSMAGPSGLDILSWPYAFPSQQPREAADLRDLAQEIVRLTRWSNRQLAAALGTTHPTVRALLRGRAEGSIQRNSEYRMRLRQLHGVAARMSVLVGEDQTRLRALMAEPTQFGSPVELMAAGRFDDAYLAAIDALRPARRAGLLTGRHPRRAGANPVGLDDLG